VPFMVNHPSTESILSIAERAQDKERLENSKNHKKISVISGTCAIGIRG
jgi:hypothetical protein